MMVAHPTLRGYLTSEKNGGIKDETIESIARALEVDKKELLYSPEKNRRIEYMRMRQEYYHTKRGILINVLITLFVIYLCVMFRRLTIYLSGVLALMFLRYNRLRRHCDRPKRVREETLHHRLKVSYVRRERRSDRCLGKGSLLQRFRLHRLRDLLIPTGCHL